MILASTTDLKKYIPVSESLEFSDFEPYIQKSVNTYIGKYVGQLHITLADESTGPNAVIENEAREHLRSAIANLGFFLYLPFAVVQMDSSGISTIVNDNKKSAEWWQVKDIRREVLRSGHESMDLLLAVLEANPSIFADYASNYSSINNELLVNNASVFSKYYNIFDSRQTYLALQPTIRLVEDQYIHTFLCEELIEALKTATSGTLYKVKTAIVKAIVAFTVAKISNNGLFLLDEKGLRVDFESEISGRKESASYGKPTDQLQTLANEQVANGTQYLNLAKTIIEANPSDFTMCTYPVLSMQTTTTSYKTYDTKGLLGL